MKSYKVIIITLILSCTSAVFSNTTTPFQFLRFNESARAAALAGCFVSMTDDASAVFFNPATISTVKDKHFSTTFLKHVLDINSGNISYIKKYDEIGTFAGAISFTSYGSFDKADQFANRNGTFGAVNMMISGTYSNELDSNLYYGVSAKLFMVTLEKYSSSAFAIDAGLIYMMPEKRTNIGVSILHAGTQITTIGGDFEGVPLDIRAGVNHRLRGLPLLINFSFHHLADRTDNFFDKFMNFSIGGEIYLGNFIQARAGYNNQTRKETSPSTDRGLSGFSGGVGIKTKDFNIDYGVAQIGKSAMLHRFSLGLDF
ncbi:MAG: type IX secretion system protein PorQ [Ignavibacteriae bacterium]|nr:type IX secretion system protein PorQ [Ignavibacteriota bacterium]